MRISAGASIEPDPKKALDYTRPLSFVVTAEDGTSIKTYKVKVNIEQDKRAEIISWKFLDKKATIKRHRYIYNFTISNGCKKLKGRGRNITRSKHKSRS